MRRSVLIVVGLVAAATAAAAPGAADENEGRGGPPMARLVDMEGVVFEDVWPPDDRVDDFGRLDHLLEEIGKDQTAGSWWDDDRKTMVVGVTDAAVPGQVRKRLHSAGFLHVVLHHVKHSQAELDAIVHGEAFDKPGLENISSAMHYYPENVVVLTSGVPVTDELRRAVYRSFGDAAMLASDPLNIRPMSDSRQADESPFAAGAGIGRLLADSWHCTLGWTWLTPAGSPHAITAGHCYPFRSGQSVATNFVDGYGYEAGWVNTSKMLYTTYETGRGTHGADGDLALIDLSHGLDFFPLGREGSARMWTNGPTSTTTTVVTSVDKWTKKKQRVCYSGRRRGVQCGREIDDVGSGGYKVTDKDYAYRNLDSRETFTHLAEAVKAWGKCPRGGDSGAPVYVNTPGVGVAAHGIVSAGGGGGDDEFVPESADGYCVMLFTEIGQAYQRWAGYVQTTD